LSSLRRFIIPWPARKRLYSASKINPFQTFSFYVFSMQQLTGGKRHWFKWTAFISKAKEFENKSTLQKIEKPQN